MAGKLVIVNMRNFQQTAKKSILVKVDRTSPLGNPFHMSTEQDRKVVCAKYTDYFIQRVIYHKDPKMCEYLNMILMYLKIYDVVYLGCWCIPLQCHAETIVAYLEGLIEREGI